LPHLLPNVAIFFFSHAKFTTPNKMTTTSPNPPLPPLILLDGGLGTTLADRYNCTFDSSTPLWSSHLLLSPSGQKTLRDAQTSFAQAGADLILSATYQASYEGFERSGVGEKEAEKYFLSAVRIARDAVENNGRDGKGGVVLGLGAYGAVMVPSQEYSGEYDAEHSSVEQLRDWHFRRVEAFMPGKEGVEGWGERKECWEGVGFVAFETLPRVEEVLAVREVMERVNGRVVEEKGFWISCVFPGEGNRLPDGNSVREVVEVMLGRGKGAVPVGVGVNCTKVGKIEGLITEFEREIARLVERGEINGGEWPSLVVYPDGTRGEVYDTVRKEWVKSREGEEYSVSFFETCLLEEI
jgi:homocysteine S-methyltransferase